MLMKNILIFNLISINMASISYIYATAQYIIHLLNLLLFFPTQLMEFLFFDVYSLNYFNF